MGVVDASCGQYSGAWPVLQVRARMKHMIVIYSCMVCTYNNIHECNQSHSLLMNKI